MKKKIISIVLALSIIVSMTGISFASDDDGPMAMYPIKFEKIIKVLEK